MKIGQQKIIGFTEFELKEDNIAEHLLSEYYIKEYPKSKKYAIIIRRLK